MAWDRKLLVSGGYLVGYSSHSAWEAEQCTEVKEPGTFVATITLGGYSRGRSSQTIAVELDEAVVGIKHANLSANELYHLACNTRIDNGTVGPYTFRFGKKGQNYFIIPVHKRK